MLTAPQPRTLDRRSKISKEEFCREYLSGSGKGVIITDAMDTWAAKSKWTFDFFRNTYGDDIVNVEDDLKQATVSRVVRLREFLDYVEAPGWSRLGKLARSKGLTQSLYLFRYAPYRLHPEILQDIGELYFCENWYSHLKPPLKGWMDELLGWIFIGPKGTLTRLHVDLLQTHAYLGQLVGRKKCVFFSPDDTPYLYGGQVDPWNPDLEKYPLYAKATPYEVILHPGELAFFPRHWWHQVLALDNSITVSFNIINETNFSDHLIELLRMVPAYIQQPLFCRALGASSPEELGGERDRMDAPGMAAAPTQLQEVMG